MPLIQDILLFGLLVLLAWFLLSAARAFAQAYAYGRIAPAISFNAADAAARTKKIRRCIEF